MNTTKRVVVDPLSWAKPCALVVSIFLCGMWSPSVLGQTEPELEARVFGALTVTGGVGQVYSIEYLTDLTDPAGGDWRCVEYLQLPASPYLWTDKSAPATGKRLYRAVTMETPTNMVFIPPGTFMMGSPTNEVDRVYNEGPQTAVTISRGYWMGKYEVTQGEYLAVMGNNPSYFTGDPLRPVEQVSWFDATAYCAALTERERAAGRITPNSVYRLPTEAEWEYACRAWTSTRFSYGEDIGYTNLTNYAWYFMNSDGQTHAVGQKSPNPWGLYDMHGNALEWCQDWWADNLFGGIALDPRGPDTGSGHVTRGGSWGVFADWGTPTYCRSAIRGFYGRTSIGFRAVLAASQP